MTRSWMTAVAGAVLLITTGVVLARLSSCALFAKRGIYERSTVESYDYATLARVLGAKIPKGLQIIRAEIKPPEMQYRGRVLYEITGNARELSRLLEDARFQRIDTATRIPPYVATDLLVFGCDVTSEPLGLLVLPIKVSWRSPDIAGVQTTEVNNYLLVDEATSPSLKVFMRSDPLIFWGIAPGLRD